MRRFIVFQQFFERDAFVGRVPVRGLLVPVFFAFLFLAIDVERFRQPSEHQHRHAEPVSGRCAPDVEFIGNLSVYI